MTLDQLAIDHEYYCHTNNYYSNDAAGRWETWGEFYKEFNDSDMDYNLIFRWDIKKRDPEDQEEGDNRTGYYMEIFIMGQRKGLFMPQVIQKITDEDVPQILEFLKPRFEYLKRLWQPFDIS